MWITLLVVISLLHLGSQLAAPGHMVSDVTQVLLMPALGGLVLATTRSPRSVTVLLTLVAVFFSWLGDSLPRMLDGDASFLTMVGCFLVAQVFYMVLLCRWWRYSVIRHPVWLAPYLVVLGILVVLCAPSAGVLLVPVVVYGLALVLMAVLSTGMGLRGGLGGGIFFVSDSLIAVRSFTDLELVAQDFWIMLTYILGQYLLVTAILDKDRVAVQVAGPHLTGR